MNRLLLFAETPRAGRWNYRFLVPLTSPVSQDDLQRYASAARAKDDGPDYLSVRREGVMQMTTERKGSEMIVLAGRDLNDMSDANRERLRQMLRRRLAELEVLVTQRIDWEREGKNLVVGRRELDQWMADVNSISVTTSQNAWRNWTVTAIILAVIVLVIAVVVGIRPIESFLQKISRTPPPSSTDTSQPEPEAPKTQPGVDSFHLAEWARILGIPAGELPKTFPKPISDFGNIGDSFRGGKNESHDKLYSDVSQAIARAIPPPEETSPPSERLRRQLLRLDSLCVSKAEPTDENRTLSQLLANQGLQRTAKKLFPQGKFSVLGLVQASDGRESEGFRLLEGLVKELSLQSADSFHKVVGAAKEVARTGAEHPSDADNTDRPEVWKVAIKAAQCREAITRDAAGMDSGEEVQTAHCFVPQDEIEVRWIVDWLRPDDVYHQVYGCEQRPENLFACLKMVADAPSESALRTKALEENLKHGTLYRDQTKAMLEFIRACQDIVNDAKPGSDVAPH